MTRVLDTKSLIWCVGCQAGQAPDSIITWENLKSGLRFVTRPWGTRLMTAFLGILTALSPVLGRDGGPSTAQPHSLKQIRNEISPSDLNPPFETRKWWTYECVGGNYCWWCFFLFLSDNRVWHVRCEERWVTTLTLTWPAQITAQCWGKHIRKHILASLENIFT